MNLRQGRYLALMFLQLMWKLQKKNDGSFSLLDSGDEDNRLRQREFIAEVIAEHVNPFRRTSEW